MSVCSHKKKSGKENIFRDLYKNKYHAKRMTFSGSQSAFLHEN
jgi:hypothetical protein